MRIGCAVQGVGMWRIACCDCGFESRQGLGSHSLVCAVLCHVDFLTTADHSTRGVLTSVVCV